LIDIRPQNLEKISSGLEVGHAVADVGLGVSEPQFLECLVLGDGLPEVDDVGHEYVVPTTLQMINSQKEIIVVGEHQSLMLSATGPRI